METGFATPLSFRESASTLVADSSSAPHTSVADVSVLIPTSLRFGGECNAAFRFQWLFALFHQARGGGSEGSGGAAAPPGKI